jgi:hypothetical protein
VRGSSQAPLKCYDLNSYLCILHKGCEPNFYKFGNDTAMSRRKHHHVYVVELSPDVLFESRFRKSNPNYVEGKPCVYVGMTGLDPDVRFDKHKAGIQANRYVQRYGLRLLPDLFEAFNPLRYEDAVDKEIDIGIDLRSAGFGVWQA